MDTSLCQIPRNTLLDIDFSYWLNPWEGSFYLLYLNGEIFVVQTPQGATYIDDNNLITAHDGVRHKHLGAMLRQIKKLPFKRYKWFVLQQDEKTKELHLAPKKESWTMYKIKAPLWLRKVQENQLQLIRWVGVGRCLCLLDGTEVDVDIAWDVLTFKKMEQMTKIVKELSELDLCYKPVAHILRGGDVIGIAYERQSGRPIQYTDKRLFYHSLSQLHDRTRACRLYLRYPYASDHWIQDGKLRVYHHLWGFDMFQGSNTKKEDGFEEKAWKTMDIVFKRLMNDYNPGPDRYCSGDPLLLQYAQWDAERPLRNPALGVTVHKLLFANRDDTLLPTRRMDGTVRSTRRLLLPGDDSFLMRRPKAVRKTPLFLEESQSASKRHRPNTVISGSGADQPGMEDDTETLVSDSEDDDEASEGRIVEIEDDTETLASHDSEDDNGSLSDEEN
ncbi:hypothetical protein PQX77_002769 [Marasmius sp. AFHP31]|nr:hypothetical protein PQX77_002769 [Marasmius sp. AFHP31]